MCVLGFVESDSRHPASLTVRTTRTTYTNCPIFLSQSLIDRTASACSSRQMVTPIPVCTAITGRSHPPSRDLIYFLYFDNFCRDCGVCYYRAVCGGSGSSQSDSGGGGGGGTVYCGPLVRTTHQCTGTLNRNLKKTLTIKQNNQN